MTTNKTISRRRIDSVPPFRHPLPALLFRLLGKAATLNRSRTTILNRKRATMRRTTIVILIFASLAMALGSCEKVIPLSLPSNSLTYLDGFITDRPGAQSVKLLRSIGYLDSGNPQPVADASITLTDLTQGIDYAFSYKDGAYGYDPGGANAIGVVGHVYRLRVDWSGVRYEATDSLKRIPPIDSLNYTYKKDDGNKKAGYYASFFAVDIPGATDYYWIRAYRNGQRNGYIFDQVSIDGAYAENTNDGLEFIYPIRQAITADAKPYIIGDTVEVVMRSLSRNSYDFMNTSLAQLVNGGLFATVMANAPANLVNQTPGDKGRIYGWFGMVAEREGSVIIK
jgi:hypothetical protein